MTKKRIMIVDDDASVTRGIKMNLENTGVYEVCVENSAVQAFSTAREFKPDLILLDVMMPGMDGGEVAQQMSASTAHNSIPIVFLTAIVSRNEVGAGEAVIGGHNFLAKPVDLADLIQCIEKHLSH